MNHILRRAIATAAAVVLYGWINFVLHPIGTIASGDVAGEQFANSNVSYVTSMVGMNLFSNLGIPAIVLLAVVLAIWWTPIRRWWVTGATAVMLCVLLAAPQAQAYYDKTDYTEAYTILPNESAFWIPDAGANKDNQAQFDSEAYLQANKIAVKRFIVPHNKLQGSGNFFDFYVPAGRLIIVDRTPFSREWVEARERGTSPATSPFPAKARRD